MLSLENMGFKACYKKPAYYARNVKFYKVVYAGLNVILCRFFGRFIWGIEFNE